MAKPKVHREFQEKILALITGEVVQATGGPTKIYLFCQDGKVHIHYRAKDDTTLFYMEPVPCNFEKGDTLTLEFKNTLFPIELDV